MSDPARDEPKLGVFDWLNRALVILIVLAAVTAIGVNYLPLIRQNQTLREKLEARQEEVTKLETELRRLDAEIRALKTDPRFIERKVRELGYAKPDELVVTFREGKAEPVRPNP